MPTAAEKRKPAAEPGSKGRAATAKAPLRPESQRKPRAIAAVAHPVVDLEHYVPAYMAWIASKLSVGASQSYLSVFGVGIETWRLLVLLAIENKLSAQRISQVIGMDKASVSRVFKSMQSRGLITMGLDSRDGRLRLATITAKGRALHEQMLGIALERERVFLSVLKPAERDTLNDLLHRLHHNLPAVEEATALYLAKNYPHAKARRKGPGNGK